MDRYFEEKGGWVTLKSAIILIICALSIGCSHDDVGKPVLDDSTRMNAPGYSIGVPQGAAAMTVVEKRFPKCRIEYFGSLNDGYLAVKHRKIDAFAFDKHTLQYVTLQNPDLAVMDEKIADESIVAGAAMGRQDLIDKVNAFIRQYRAEGTYKDMYRRWLLKEGKGMPLLPEPMNPTATLKIGTEGLNEPMNYYADGLLTGFDMEFARRLGIFLNTKVTFHAMEFSALVPAVETGKIDLLIAGLNATDERRKKILMSDVYIDSEIAFLVRKDRLPAKATGQAITDFSQLAGRKVGILTGSSYDALIKKELPTAIPFYFNTFADQAAALKAGQIEGFLVDEPVARDIVKSTSGITCLKKMVCTDSYAFAFAKDRQALHAEVNAALNEFHDQGVIKAIDAKWFGDNEAAKVLPELKTDGRNGVIRFATDSSAPPFVFVKDGRIVGYEIEIAARVADKLGRRLEIINMDFAAIIPALVSGKADMAGSCITVTEERARSVLFSLPTYSVGVALMVASSAPVGGQHGGSALYSGLIESFRRTFLVEDRWIMILRGLQTTVLIAVLSAIFGTLLGALVCIMRRTQTRWMNIPAKVFIRAIQGTPIVVLLMILYYIVFGGVDINGLFVAVIGFSINFAAYVSEMMRTGIDTVDRGQREAATAIGFSRFQVFLRITFPQAARHVLPVFKGEFISMLKMTSIVGYIAIQDLTKMSDIIRSRTYEAFFPLIATALIYFVIAYIMISLLSLLEMRIDPRRRRRLVRGVVSR
jgi:polar amino acid transport system substrate-binding protein